MVTDIDPQGKIRLSRQAVLEGWSAEEAAKKTPVRADPAQAAVDAAATAMADAVVAAAVGIAAEENSGIDKQ